MFDYRLEIEEVTGWVRTLASHLGKRDVEIERKCATEDEGGEEDKSGLSKGDIKYATFGENGDGSYKLYPYQIQGVRYACHRGGKCIIGDEMGLGKTLQAL